ncbi:MAG: efflux RND transporter periplasmic adaptor subunit [Syntrophobacteraceae bacterium]|nr:efflux RND transporter periplasmic adaptor subunit [Syntrophobacteraceae bacterium]
MKITRFIPLLALCAIIAVVAFVAGQISEKNGRPRRQTQQGATVAKTRPSSQKPADKPKILYWRSSMDPNFVSKKPGKDAMGMDLVPVYENEAPGKKAPAPAKSPEGKRKILYYRDPMDPNYVSKKPGKAPCGMDLVPVYADEATSGKIHISSAVVQQIGVTTTKATSGPFTKTIQTYGTSTWNETTLVALNTKINGWIEKLDVNVMGQVVRKGQPLIRIYSPELLSAQQEYLAALDNAKALEGSPLSVMAGAAAKLPEAARMRLKLWDISDQQIAELRATRRVRKNLTLYAPISGIVTKLDVMQGDYVQAGRNLMKIAGLNPIWVMASLYEDQIPMVKKGMMATVAFDSLPGESFQGMVDYVYPFVEGKSRTAQVRIVLPNPKGHILPQMYGTVKLISPINNDAVQIPSDAVIRASSTDSEVFMALGNGEFAGRKVILGPEGDDGMVMVRAGLKAGERIVTSAQFLLDAESRLNSAAQSMLSNGGSSK